ncbi:MAG TPA: SBBP repeat-containing protein [Flavobacteriales bacterium]
MRTILVLTALLSVHVLPAQQWNWAASAGGGGNVDFCHDIATDRQGNAYWVGSASGEVDFGCATLNTGNSDVLGFLAKRAPDGSCVWVRGITTTLFEAWAYGIAIDAQDRIYITGRFRGNADFGGGVTLNGFSGDDIFLARFDTAGTCLWARRAGSSSNDEARGVEVSPQGDVFIAGTCNGTSFTFDATVLSNPGNYKQIVVARYDSTGTVQWAKASTGNGQGKSARAISVVNDRLFVTGQVGASAATFDGTALTPGAQGTFLYVLATDLDGNAMWARSYGRGDHEGMGISADSLGNVFVAGRMWGDLYLQDDTLSSVSSNDDILVMKLDRDGGFQWARSTGSSLRDLAWGVAADGMGNAYFASQFLQTIDYFGTSVTSLGGEDILISKLDGQGDLVWVARPSGFQRDVPLCIHRRAAAPHELFFGGYFWGSITYGNTTIDDVLNGDAMIVAGVDTTFHISSQSADAGCPADCNGVVHAFVNGVAPFSFEWENGDTTSTISGLCAGTYTVTVTDGEGQVGTATVVVGAYADPGFTIQQSGMDIWVDGGTAWQWFHDGLLIAEGNDSLTLETVGAYHAWVTDIHGCSWSTDTVVLLSTDVQTVITSGLRLFPNPVHGMLQIESGTTGPLTVEVLDQSGRVVVRRTFTSGTGRLSVENLPAGAYLLRSSDGRHAKLLVE